jgi:Xaa-Pro aminopeptidase
MSESLRASEAILIYAATEPGVAEWSADLQWRIKFIAPDPILYIETGGAEGKKILIASSLEFGRAKQEASVDEVILLDDIRKEKATFIEVLADFLRSRGVSKLVVPAILPYRLGRELERQGFEIETRPGSMFPERAQKTSWEVQEIIKAGEAVSAILEEMRVFLKESIIDTEHDCVMHNGEVVTSESLRTMIEQRFFMKGYHATQTIVAGGMDTVSPHNIGHGPIRPHQPIVCDIVPSSIETHYFTDISRTFFKGEPSDQMKRMYTTILEAEESAIAAVKAGEEVRNLEGVARDIFKRDGYLTRTEGGVSEGFIHSLGHGVGLEMHEDPHVANLPLKLEAGNVITIEPGLYYPEATENHPAGGIRIEDIMLVEEAESRLLSPIPKGLDWAIIP